MQRQKRAFALLAALLVIGLGAMAATKSCGVAIITQADVTKGSIPGTNGAAGFPVTITSPGSYKLGSDLRVPAAVGGIDINAGDVTLDLNGFNVHGPETCTGRGANLSCTGSNAGSGIASSARTLRSGTAPCAASS